MNEIEKGKLINRLQAAIIACAVNAEKAGSALEALQYTQAALNATNALVLCDSV